MRRWLAIAPKGRHRRSRWVTVRSEMLYALLGALVGAMVVLAGLGYYVTFGGSLG
jgi:hypothetical protein